MNDNNTDVPEDATDEPLEDVAEALESTGAVEPEGEPEDGEEDADGLPGPLGMLEGLQGSGKGLDSYSNSPIAEALGPEDSKGAKHIARGVDGLSPLGAAHPLVDIGIGVVLLKMEQADREETESGDGEIEQANPGDDPRSRVSDDLA